MEPKNILITGCSSGIGKNAAITLHNKGWRVFATCRSKNDCNFFKNLGIESFELDLQRQESINNAIRLIKKKTKSQLDALYNNGAYAIPGAIQDMPRDALREIFEVNVFGQLELLRKCLPLMRANNGGTVINCSSVLGFTAIPFRGAYIGTKFALEGITDTIRRENIDQNIRYVLIEPGPINTQIRFNSQKHYEKWIDKNNSAYREIYERDLEKRLYQNKVEDFFELEPQAVTKKVIKALESKNPKARYYVTLPTFFSAIINRIFGSRLLDFILKYRPYSN